MNFESNEYKLRFARRSVFLAAMICLAIGFQAPIRADAGGSGDASSFQPVGEEFQVNALTTGDQGGASVAGFPDGFVAVWQSNGSVGDDIDQSIQGRVFDLDGDPVGEQFQVNSYTTSLQNTPRVAAWPDGSFVVLWYTPDLRLQVFDDVGSTFGPEVAVPLSAAGGVNMATGDEDVLVVWSSTTGDGDGESVLGRRFSAEGAILGAEFVVNAFTTGGQSEPDIVRSPDGGFVVVWEGDGPATLGGGGSAIHLRRLASDGTPLGGDFEVSTASSDQGTIPRIGMGGDGSFVVAWSTYESPGDDDSGTSVVARRFDSAAQPIGADFQVNSYTTLFQYVSDVAVEPDGSFLVVWRGDGADSAAWGIAGRRFDSAGAPVGDDFQINSYVTGYQQGGRIAESAGGVFLLVWNSDSGIGDTDRSVQGRIVLGDLIFADGFESGDTSAWFLSDLL